MNQVSDAPDSISTLLAARANLSTAQQIGSNLARFKAEADGAEQALQGAVRLFDQGQTLGATGDTDTATASSRSVLAQQLGSILEQMGGLAATQIEDATCSPAIRTSRRPTPSISPKPIP